MTTSERSRRMSSISQLGRVIVHVFGEGDRWVEVTPPQGGAAIALSPGMGEFQPGRETGIALTAADAKAAHAELKEKGVQVEEPMGGDGTVPLLFMFKDGDGNGLMVVEQQDA